MKEGKKTTIFYHDWIELFEKLDPAEVGELTMALLRLDSGQGQTAFREKHMDLLFTDLARTVTRNREAYNRTCEKKAEYYRKKKEKDSTLQSTIEDYSPLHHIDSDIENDIDIDSGSGSDSDIDGKIRTIIREWNYRKYKKAAITGIPFGQKRYNDTFTCITQYGFGPFMDEIRQLDTNAFFESWHPSYDWFCNPNNFVKVMEGNYREKRKDPNEIDWEAL